eukprot:SAG31_NODE_2454_length_5664_cov_4.255885_6_plen_97_part_00
MTYALESRARTSSSKRAGRRSTAMSMMGMFGDEALQQLPVEHLPAVLAVGLYHNPALPRLRAWLYSRVAAIRRIPKRWRKVVRCPSSLGHQIPYAF